MAVSISGSGAITGMVSADSSDLSTELDAKLDTPGAWTSYTPTVTAGSGTLTSYTINSAAYTQIGKTVIVRFDVAITNAGTGASALQITLPVAAVAAYRGTGSGREMNYSGWIIQVQNDTTSRVYINYYDNTTPIRTGNRVSGNFIYEAA